MVEKERRGREKENFPAVRVSPIFAEDQAWRRAFVRSLAPAGETASQGRHAGRQAGREGFQPLLSPPDRNSSSHNFTAQACVRRGHERRRNMRHDFIIFVARRERGGPACALYLRGGRLLSPRSYLRFAFRPRICDRIFRADLRASEPREKADGCDISRARARVSPFSDL